MDETLKETLKVTWIKISISKKHGQLTGCLCRYKSSKNNGIFHWKVTLNFLKYILLEAQSTVQHLGLLFSHDLIWSVFVYRIFGYLKNLNLLWSNIIFLNHTLFFLIPVLENTYVVWDGCTMSGIEKIEKVHSSTARSVTCLPILESKEPLHSKTRWEFLFRGCHRAKITTMQCGSWISKERSFKI